MRLTINSQVADVAPVAVGHIAVHRLIAQKQEGEKIIREILFTAHNYIEHHFGLKYVSAGIDCIRKNFRSAWFFHKALNASFVVGNDDAVFEGVLDSFENQGGFRFLLFMKL
ncbi:MAG: hypothetical protein BWY75_02862 [bacterium ADurb.Bin425]|nr:MAG: hypothetical protein BWY75_02862 [bacterium ADurb.Bin425]